MSRALLILALLASRALVAQAPLEFAVEFSLAFSRQAHTGDLYLILADEAVGEPRNRLEDFPMRGFVFKQAVRNWKPGEPVIFDASTPGFPGSLSALPPGRYGVQAILDIHHTEANFRYAAGNGRSRALRPLLDPAAGGRISVTIDTEILQPKSQDRGRIRYRKLELRNIGRAIGERYFAHVAIVLPSSYSPKSDRTYPVQYWIPAMGVSSRGVLQYFQSRGVYDPIRDENGRGQEFVKVLVGSLGRRGHLGWVDSENNGSASMSFVDEIIPAIEAEFPAIAKPEARFLVGHSLGGWSALSLLVDHPQKFAGAWALAPDPVDFQDFYGVDLYASRANLYVDQRGLERYLARVGGRGAVTFRTQAAFEEIVGTGNLLQSWEAMLSPRGVDGEPRPMFDRVTGAIDGNVVQQWSRHDIHRKLAANWNRDGRYLAGKIHIKVGDADNYWLHRPLVGLAESLDAWKADAQVEFLPGLDHLALDAVPIHRQVQREIEAMWENRAR